LYMRKKQGVEAILLVWCLAAVLSLCGCGSRQKVSNEAITVYLNKIYLVERGLELTKISDVVETPGDAANQIVLTCTTTAHNQYAEQKANWTLRFEMLEDSWVGTEYSKGVTEDTLYEVSPDGFVEIAFAEHITDGTPLLFDILEYETDLENGVIGAECVSYSKRPAYYWERFFYSEITWNSSNVCYKRNGETEEGEWFNVLADLSGHYDVEVPEWTGTYRDRFDLEKTEDPNVYIIKNFISDRKDEWGEMWDFSGYRLEFGDSGAVRLLNNKGYDYYEICFELKGDKFVYAHNHGVGDIIWDFQVVELRSGLSAPLPFEPQYGRGVSW